MQRTGDRRPGGAFGHRPATTLSEMCSNSSDEDDWKTIGSDCSRKEDDVAESNEKNSSTQGLQVNEDRDQDQVCGSLGVGAKEEEMTKLESLAAKGVGCSQVGEKIPVESEATTAQSSSNSEAASENANDNEGQNENSHLKLMMADEWCEEDGAEQDQEVGIDEQLTMGGAEPVEEGNGEPLNMQVQFGLDVGPPPQQRQSARPLLPVLEKVSSRFPCLPQLESPLQLDDFRVFLPPELSKLPTHHPSRTEPPINWRAIALHYINLLKVSEPWMTTMEHLADIITDEESEERASEDQVFMWILSQSSDIVHPHLLRLRMVRNPVPFILNGAVLRDIGASMPAAPLLLNLRFGDRKIGVSRLSNEMWQTDFEVNDDDFDNSGYMQIQFPMDYKQPGRGFAVADAHGKMDDHYEVFMALVPHVQAVVIHVDSSKANDKRIVSIVADLCTKEKPVVVLLRDAPEVKKRCQECLSSQFPMEVLVMCLPNFQAGEKLLKDQASELRKVLMKPEHLGTALGCGNRGAPCFSRVSLEALVGNRSYPEVNAVVEAIATRPDELGKLAQAHASICEESKKIRMSNVQDDRQTLIQCYEVKQQKVKQLRALCSSGHRAIDQFVHCVGHEDAEAQIQELQRQCIPVHILFKELYLLIEEGKLQGSLAEEGPRALAAYIWAGNPFEIFDGDNFYLHVDSLSKAFEILDGWLAKAELLLDVVESTLGPQSSGKSTLKNSKYGCRFDVSEGRCTRGVTGQLVRTEHAARLILDTEGLQSVEKGDPHYDRVMTLLMLAASHRIDVNIKGNMNEPMKRLFEICVRASMHLEIAKLPSPELHWIFNQVADPNKKHHQDSFRLMKEELKDAFAHDGAATLDQIQLHEDNITVVPSMFNGRVAYLGEAAGTWTRLEISPDYSERCQEMRRGSALQQVERPLQPGADGQEGLTLHRWLALFADIFRTIQAYPDLTHFQDIRQVRLDCELRSWIGLKLKQRFQSDEGLKEEHVKMDQWCSNPVLEDAQIELNHYFSDLSEDLKEMLKSRCRELGCDALFMDRYEKILDSKLTTRRCSWQTQLQRHFKEAEVKSACVEGHGRIRQRIRELLRQQDAHEGDIDLEQEFETLFTNVTADMQDAFRKESFDYDLLRRMHAVSGSKYRMYFHDLHDSARHTDISAFPLPDGTWITRDREGPALPWSSPPQGASWTRLFRLDFLAAVSPAVPVADPVVAPGHYQLALLDQPAVADHVQSESSWGDTLTSMFTPLFGRSARKLKRRATRKVASPGAYNGRRMGQGKQQRTSQGWDQLIEHLWDPRQSRLSDHQVCVEVMSVIIWQRAFRDLDKRVAECVENPVCRPDINLVQLVEQAAANVSDEVGMALKAVGCKLTRNGMREFVSRALIKSWHLVKDHHFDSYMRPIHEFELEKERQKEYFIASIKQDKDSDKIVARKLAREVGEIVLSDVTKEAERCVKQVVSKNSLKLGREALQEASDAYLGTDDIDAQLENILTPAKAIERQFDLAFHEVKREAKHACACDCIMEAELKLKQLSSHAEALYRLPGMEQENTMSEQAFELDSSHSNHSGGPAVTRAAKRWAARQWLRSAFTELAPVSDWQTPNLRDVDALRVHVREGKLAVQQTFRPLVEDAIRGAVRRAWQDDSGDVGGLGCMHVVLREMATSFSELWSDIQGKLDLKIESLLEGLRSELRSQVVPCRAQCPCCGRICDNAELGSGHIHRCASGHQCRGFKGVYLEDGKKTASTRICSQVKDEDKYKDEQGREWKWCDYKKSLEDSWDFSDKFAERAQDFQVRMLLAWRMVGPQICQHFGTRWTELGEEQTLSSAATHFMLALDSSGSMGVAKWTALHQAVSAMFQERKKTEGSAADRVSACAFSGEYKQLFTFEDLEQSQLRWNELTVRPMKCTGTNFSAAIQSAVSTLKDCAHHRHHRLTFIFMSDGIGSTDHLESVIQELKKNVGDRPFKAYTIGFGAPDSFGRLKDIAEMLNGKHVEAVTDMDLTNIFVEVAQRTEGGI